jgi:hypothetical protein
MEDLVLSHRWQHASDHQIAHHPSWHHRPTPQLMVTVPNAVPVCRPTGSSAGGRGFGDILTY